jgi:hypothetical protein
MFHSVVFTSNTAFKKAIAAANNVVAIHEPFLMLIYENLNQSKLDMRYVKYIVEAPSKYCGKTGLVLLRSHGDKFYDAVDYLIKNKIIIKERFEGTQTIIVEMPTMGNYTKFYEQLIATGLFTQIEEDLTGKTKVNDVQLGEEFPYPFFTYLQHGWLAPINAAEALATFNSIQAEAHVAIFDTKVDINHPDLIGRTAANHDCVANVAGADYNPTFVSIQPGALFNQIAVYDRHGTPMAGIVAANSVNGILVESHTRNKVKAQVLRVLYPVAEEDGPVPVEWITVAGIAIYYATSTTIVTRAINKAMENPKCAAISISWEEDPESAVFSSGFLLDLIESVITTARNCKGIPIFTAAGNDDTLVGAYPAVMEQTICIGGTVGTTAGTSLKADFANYGERLWVSAPAVNVYTTDAVGTNGYVINLPNPIGTTEVVRFSGTSASAPIAAGVAAIMVLVNPALTEYDIRKILKETAQQVGGYTYTDAFSQELGYGLVDMQAAVEAAEVYDFLATPTDYTVSITVPASAQAGASIAIPWTVDIDPGYTLPAGTNCPSAADLPKLAFYRSSNPTYFYTSSGAVPIGFVTLDLEVGDTTASGTFNYVVPCNVTGNMYIFAMVDSTSIVGETDEENNIDSGVVAVSGLLPGCLATDLSVSVLSTQIMSNGLRRMIIRFTNTGQTNITTWNITHGWINNTGNPATVNVNMPGTLVLAPGNSRNISLFAVQSPQGLPNTFYVQINTVNGSPDAVPSNNYSSLVVTA